MEATNRQSTIQTHRYDETQVDFETGDERDRSEKRKGDQKAKNAKNAKNTKNVFFESAELKNRLVRP